MVLCVSGRTEEAHLIGRHGHPPPQSGSGARTKNTCLPTSHLPYPTKMRSLLPVLSLTILSSFAQEDVEVGKRIKEYAYLAFPSSKGRWSHLWNAQGASRAERGTSCWSPTRASWPTAPSLTRTRERIPSGLVSGHSLSRFVLGEGRVIAGWEKGLEGTCAGEKVNETPLECRILNLTRL